MVSQKPGNRSVLDRRRGPLRKVDLPEGSNDLGEMLLG
jgi:hypothetical protein